MLKLLQLNWLIVMYRRPSWSGLVIDWNFLLGLDHIIFQTANVRNSWIGLKFYSSVNTAIWLWSLCQSGQEEKEKKKMVPAVAEMSSNSLIIGFSSSNQKRFHLSGTICKVAFTETAGTTSNFYNPLKWKCHSSLRLQDLSLALDSISPPQTLGPG